MDSTIRIIPQCYNVKTKKWVSIRDGDIAEILFDQHSGHMGYYPHVVTIDDDDFAGHIVGYKTPTIYSHRGLPDNLELRTLKYLKRSSVTDHSWITDDELDEILDTYIQSLLRFVDIRTYHKITSKDPINSVDDSDRIMIKHEDVIIDDPDDAKGEKLSWKEWAVLDDIGKAKYLKQDNVFIVIPAPGPYHGGYMKFSILRDCVKELFGDADVQIRYLFGFTKRR